VKKAFQFQDFTDWYKQRGTGEGGAWLKSVTLGHSMAKTRYNWSGTADEAKKFESTRDAEKFGQSIFGAKKAGAGAKNGQKQKVGAAPVAPKKAFQQKIW
jgi:hypothetical protein